jgi:hypothetical protein
MSSRSRSGRDEKKPALKGLAACRIFFFADNGLSSAVHDRARLDRRVESGAYASPAPRATSLRSAPISKRHRPRDSCAIDGRAERVSHRSSALRRQRPQIRILSGAPIISICYVKARGRPERFGYTWLPKQCMRGDHIRPCAPVARIREACAAAAIALRILASCIKICGLRRLCDLLPGQGGVRHRGGRDAKHRWEMRRHCLLVARIGSSDAALAPYHVERSTRRTAAVRKQRPVRTGVMIAPRGLLTRAVQLSSDRNSCLVFFRCRAAG